MRAFLPLNISAVGSVYLSIRKMIETPRKVVSKTEYYFRKNGILLPTLF